MNIAPTHLNPLTLPVPVKAFWHWLLDKPGRPSTRALDYSGPTTPAALRQVVEFTALPGSDGCPRARPTASVRPLRVVRVIEANQAPAQVGRMVISGRMADVCKELDRLASLA